MKEPTRQEVAQAAQKCIDDKWEPKTRGQHGISSCALCVLSHECPRCPMHDEGYNCCKEFSAWREAAARSKEEWLAAQAVVDKLKRIVKEYSEVDNAIK